MGTFCAIAAVSSECEVIGSGECLEGAVHVVARNGTACANFFTFLVQAISRKFFSFNWFILVCPLEMNIKWEWLCWGSKGKGVWRRVWAFTIICAKSSEGEVIGTVLRLKRAVHYLLLGCGAGANFGSVFV